MTKKELIALIMEARNTLYKQKLGEEVTHYDIENAFERIDIAVDVMVRQDMIY